MKTETIAELNFDTKPKTDEDMDPFAGPVRFFELTSIAKAEVQITPPLAEWTDPDVVPKLLVKSWIITGGFKTAVVYLDYDPDQRCLTVDGNKIQYQNIEAVSKKCDEVYQQYFKDLQKDEEQST